jgi:hypothetical protein
MYLKATQMRPVSPPDRTGRGKSHITMSQSLSKVYVHITFSTKNHQPFIDDDIKVSLLEYIERQTVIVSDFLSHV